MKVYITICYWTGVFLIDTCGNIGCIPKYKHVVYNIKDQNLKSNILWNTIFGNPSQLIYIQK